MFRDEAGKQQSLRLGRCTKNAARTALAAVERLLEAKRLGTTLHPDAIRWLESIDDRMHERVVVLGLTKPRQGKGIVTLDAMLSAFFAWRT